MEDLISKFNIQGSCFQHVDIETTLLHRGHAVVSKTFSTQNIVE